MAMESLIGQGIGDAHDDMSDAGFTMWQYQHEKRMQDRASEKSLRNSIALNNQLAGLSEQARRQSAADMVAGYRAAGLSPLMLSGVGFGAVGSGGGAPVAANSGPVSRHGQSNLGALALEQAKYDRSERRLMDAQSSNLEAEAAGKKLDNANKTAESVAAHNLMTAEIHFIKSSQQPTSDLYQWADALEKSGNLNLGSLNGYREFFGSLGAMTDYRVQNISNKLAHDIYLSQSVRFDSDPEYQNIVGNLPKEQAKSIGLANAKVIADTIMLYLMTQNENVKTDILEKQRDLLDKQIQELATLIRATHHNDLVAMWEDGEYSSLLVKETAEIAPKIAEGGVLGLLLGGPTFMRRMKNRSVKTTPLGDLSF